jgi:hypothetical protein
MEESWPDEYTFLEDLEEPKRYLKVELLRDRRRGD